MRLLKVIIAGYRSIRNPGILHLERGVTVILGPNDHGKTNCLNALLHLNDDHPFDEDDDLNWDCPDSALKLPSIVAHFTLSASELEEVLAFENKLVEAYNFDAQEIVKAPKDGTGTSQVNEPESLETYPLAKRPDFAAGVIATRAGVEGDLELSLASGYIPFTDTLESVKKKMPRFELINPISTLSDSVTADEILPKKNEFMRGIFRYAGLDPDASSKLFEQNYRTQRELEDASTRLDATLRQSWTQGSDLKFILRHDSKRGRIELMIKDPAVGSRYVEASRRSSGFTHYFALKTILHSRQQDHAANSYFLLFDEPGIYLHPSGQHDLIQVLETLSSESQIAYVTHSLFMINKTFPTRHRLLMKGADGTVLDGKPYSGRWQAVLDSLGITLTGTILFANFVVLTEGDSDPIYLYAVLQKGAAVGKCSIDLGAVAFMATGESRHADVLMRLLQNTTPCPTVGVLVDGDQGGSDRLFYLKALIKKYGIPERTLAKDTSLEDHLPNLREVFVPALASYIVNLVAQVDGDTLDLELLTAKLWEKFDADFEKGKVTSGVSKWATKAAMEIGGLKCRPSKVGIAREYAVRLLELPETQLRWEERPKAIVEWLAKKVKVPELAPVAKAVLQNE